MRALLFYACLPFVAYLGLTRPFYGLAIYLSANIIRPEMLFWGGHTGSLIFRVSICSALLGYLIRGSNVFRPLLQRESVLLLWIWLAVAASLTVASIPLAPKAWMYAEEFIKLWVVGWLILGLVRDEHHTKALANILLTAASLLALWGWDQSFRGNERLEHLGGMDSNGVAAFASLFFPIALHKLLMGADRKQRTFGFVCALLLGVMIVFTKSRGGFLGLAAGVIYLLLRTPNRKALVSYIAILTLFASPLIGSDYVNRVSTISADQEETDMSGSSRLVLWTAGWLVFKDHPVLGVGLLNFPVAKGPYRTALAGQFDEALLDYSFQGYKVGHSTWFCQLLAEGGLSLTIPYLLLIWFFFRAAYRLRHAFIPDEEARELYYLLIGLEAGVFACCVSSCFIDNLLSIFLPVQLLLGIQIVRVIEDKGRVWEGGIRAGAAGV